MVLKSSLLYSSYVKMGKTARAELAFSTKLHSLRFDFWQLESYRCGLRFLRTGCGRCGSWPMRYPVVLHCQGGVWRCRQYVGNWELGAIQHLPSHLFERRMRVFDLILKKGCRPCFWRERTCDTDYESKLVSIFRVNWDKRVISATGHDWSVPLLFKITLLLFWEGALT